MKQGTPASHNKEEGKKQAHHNHLRFEKSPYLLQHANNPVDWYPWGDEAFEKAKREDKPIFLSIGYSTCHWCHVMAHESFEDTEVAKRMNDDFVSIKVDREERPDIDQLYMSVCQLLTGSGGWPLSIIMTPEKKPFFAATYIPKKTRFGMAGMLDLMAHVLDIWTTRRHEVLRTAEQVTAALQHRPFTSPTPVKGAVSEQKRKSAGKALLERTYTSLVQNFDEIYGGFGRAPKFPSPHNLLFLLRYWRRSGDEKALRMVEETLQHMRWGGIYDHIGFGFHRYSTDARWLVPHFEKMLYDQAMLTMAYVESFQATGKEEYRTTAEEVLNYVLRDMTDTSGAFYSAEDADSQGEEGKFYLWTKEEIQHVLDDEAEFDDGDGAELDNDETEFVCSVLQVQKDGNFAEEASRQRTGTSILHLKEPLERTASSRGIPMSEFREKLGSARQKLFTSRERRVHPHKDDKVLTDWNGLMIAAFSKAGQAFDEPSYVEAAGKAADFILKFLRRDDGRLLHRYRDGEAGILATIDDHAFFVWGLLELYEASFETRYLVTALEISQELLQHFWDEENGGFYFTPDDGETLLTRQKEFYDGAIPSGNSVMLLNLLRLARLTADPEFEEKAAEMTTTFFEQAKQHPMAHTQFMVALDFALGPSHEVVVVEGPEKMETREMITTLRQHFIPSKVVLFRPVGAEETAVTGIAPFVKDLTTIDGKTTAYVCSNFSCQQPTTEPDTMLRHLGEGEG